MEYELVYDMMTKSARPFIDYVFIVGGVGLIWTGIRGWSYRKGGPVRRFFWSLVTVLAGIFSIYVFVTMDEYAQKQSGLIAAYEQSQFEIVEGMVENFQTFPWYANGVRENFTVAGNYFEYSNAHLTGGYRKTKSYGGRIREGSYVIIWHVDGIVVHLEITKDQDDAIDH